MHCIHPNFGTLATCRSRARPSHRYDLALRNPHRLRRQMTPNNKLRFCDMHSRNVLRMTLTEYLPTHNFSDKVSPTYRPGNGCDEAEGADEYTPEIATQEAILT